MGDFEADTRLEGENGRYRASISRDWEIWGPNGGYVAAIALRAAGLDEDKVKLIINHSTSSNSLQEEDVERVLEYKVTWRIPHDYNVASSNQLGIPIVVAKPYARVSRAVTDMAHALSGTPQQRTGFLERFLGRAS